MAKKLWLENTRHEFDWMLFAKLDVELFFMKIRTIFDYVAIILGRISDYKRFQGGEERF